MNINVIFDIPSYNIPTYLVYSNGTSNGSNDFHELSRRHSQDLIKAQALDKLQEQLNKAQEVCTNAKRF